MKKLLPLLALLLLCAGCGFLNIQIGTTTAATTAVTTTAATTKATTDVTAAATTAATTSATTAKTTAAATAKTTAAATSSATSPVTTTAVATTTTAVTTTIKPWQDPYPEGISGWYDVPAYLEGDWWLLPKGWPEQSQNTMLCFRSEDGIISARFMRWLDGASVTAHADLSDLGEPDGDACDVLSLSISAVTPSFSTNWASLEESGTSDYQILAAGVDGQDILALRELGNGDSMFASDALRYDRAAAERLWVFRRETKAGVFAPTEEQYDAMRAKGRTFYAYCWQQSEAGCFLQEMTVEQSTVDWYGDGVRVLRCLWYNNGHAFTAVRYDSAVPFEREQTVMKGTPTPAVRPRFVRATTDEYGIVTKLEEVPYFAYGYYYAPGIR